MDLDPTTESRATPDVWLRAFLRGLSRIPSKALLVLGLFLLVAALMAVHTAFLREDCGLRLRVQHGFRSAQLFVWLDDAVIYSGRLIGSSQPIPSGKRKGKPIGPVEGSLSETFAVPAGEHEVRVRVAAEDGSVQENSTRGDFVSHGQRTLSVVARGDDVSMNWESENPWKASGPSPKAEPVQTSESWFQRYAGAVLVSVAGSIVSALVGFAIKELPKKITSPRAEPPKTRSASAGR